MCIRDRNEGDLDYEKTFQELQKVRAQAAAPGIRVYATGQPVLIGWVYTYLSQIIQIFLYTMALMVFLLVMHFRCFYGVFLPLLGIALSSIWGLGFISLLKWNLDPLNLFQLLDAGLNLSGMGSAGSKTGNELLFLGQHVLLTFV